MPNIRDASALVKQLADVVKSHVSTALGPLSARVKALEDQQPQKGEKGEPGAPGRDADQVDVEAIVDAVVAKLLVSDRLDTLADLKAAAAVEKHFEENPIQHGRDGERGPQGERGEAGQPGKDGRDGLDVGDMLRNADGHLIAVMSDGTTRDLGEFVGKDGKDGRDGLSMADVTHQYDAEAHEITLRWTVGDEKRSLTYPAGGIRAGGFWSEGKKALAGQAFTHDGALWIAKRDTTVKPSLEAKDDWQLAARKGRDGKDGRNGIDRTASVKVEGQ